MSLRAFERFPLAFDRAASALTIDQDGRLHVAMAPITSAAVNGYAGSEIPGWQALGLRESETYQLLRDPDELAKSVPTFNNLPILSTHVPVSADDHRPDLVCGSTGTDCKWDGQWLRVSLVFWTRDAIDAIESGEQRALSAAYRYTPVMEPGQFQGQRFSGRMTALVGNHIATCSEGRVAGAVIGDALPAMTSTKSFAACFPNAARITVSPY